MRRNKPEYKIWKKRNDKKKLKNKKKYKKYKNKNIEKLLDSNHNNIDIDETFPVPKIFSIIKNPEETIKFFNDIIEKIEIIRNLNKQEHKKKIYSYKLNMQSTYEITGDALMYLLTIIRNTRGEKLLPINWIGNFPANKEMCEYLKKSGYLNYMKTSKQNLRKTTEYVQIRTGKTYVYHDKSDVDIRQEVIDFTCNKLNKDKTKINFLMTMLTEMITNISDHAYDNENIFENSWYIFVENNIDTISYTFMDNGLGIPTTIKKRNFEKIINKNEWKYIESGVSGIEKRSSTGKIERGNGLPSIYEQYTSSKICNLKIISNKAYFVKDNEKDLINDLKGTIFYWEIKKEEVNKNED